MKPRWLRLLLAVDQFFAVLLLDTSEDETISSYVGRTWPGGWQERFINFLFMDEQHCRRSIEYDEVTK